MSTKNVKKKSEEVEKESIGIGYLKAFIIDIIDLSKGVDKQGTIAEIKAKKSMSGANAWMLMCSIIIASIGLDRNSDAVIIGAMLISPLMSPILGVGLGIGINDKEVVKESVIHFSIAMLIALVTSTIYFSLSPFGDINDSISSRTEPLTLDVVVAIFGGLAGIISIARKDISTTLPGVAIATALMPPLCVTGFGIANGDWDIALNSYYLFILNSSFISISTYLIVRYLGFPYRRYVNPKERLRNRIVIIIFTLLMIIPSFFILKKVLNKLHTKSTITNIIKQEFGDNIIYLDGYSEQVTDTSATLVLKVYGELYNQSHIPKFKESLKKAGLSNWNVQIIQSSEVNLEEIRNLETKIGNIEVIALREKEIRDAENKLSSVTLDSIKVLKICEEFRVIFDDVESISYAKMQQVMLDQSSKILPTFICETKKKLDNQVEMKMSTFLKLRFEVDSVRLVIL